MSGGLRASVGLPAMLDRAPPEPPPHPPRLTGLRGALNALRNFGLVGLGTPGAGELRQLHGQRWPGGSRVRARQRPAAGAGAWGRVLASRLDAGGATAGAAPLRARLGRARPWQLPAGARQHHAGAAGDRPGRDARPLRAAAFGAGRAFHGRADADAVPALLRHAAGRGGGAGRPVAAHRDGRQLASRAVRRLQRGDAVGADRRRAPGSGRDAVERGRRDAEAPG